MAFRELLILSLRVSGAFLKSQTKPGASLFTSSHVPIHVRIIKTVYRGSSLLSGDRLPERITRFFIISIAIFFVLLPINRFDEIDEFSRTAAQALEVLNTEADTVEQMLCVMELGYAAIDQSSRLIEISPGLEPYGENAPLLSEAYSIDVLAINSAISRIPEEYTDAIFEYCTQIREGEAPVLHFSRSYKDYGEATAILASVTREFFSSDSKVMELWASWTTFGMIGVTVSVYLQAVPLALLLALLNLRVRHETRKALNSECSRSSLFGLVTLSLSVGFFGFFAASIVGDLAAQLSNALVLFVYSFVIPADEALFIEQQFQQLANAIAIDVDQAKQEICLLVPHEAPAGPICYLVDLYLEPLDRATGEFPWQLLFASLQPSTPISDRLLPVSEVNPLSTLALMQPLFTQASNESGWWLFSGEIVPVAVFMLVWSAALSMLSVVALIVADMKRRILLARERSRLRELQR